MERTRTPGTQGRDVCGGGLEVLAAVVVKQAELPVFMAAGHSSPPHHPVLWGLSGFKSQQAKENGICSDIKLETQ